MLARLWSLSRRLPCLLFIILTAAAALVSPSHAQSAVSYTALTNDQPVFGSLAASSAAYYSFAVLGVSSPQQQQQTVLLGVSALTGSPSLYVSLLDSPPPSSVSCNWSASWQTGNVLTLPQPPPYTAHVAVVASPYSSSNYTLTVTAYDPAVKQSTPIPLYGAQPTSSAIAAGEYRYYTYNISSNSTAATIALTETYGQSWLLLNSPNTTALPTVSAAQYRSTSATFPLVALQRPAAGVWTIGVWCNASSAFTIVAVSPQQSVSMELGITYPGYLPAAQLASYSVYLDPLLLATAAVGYLDFELSTLSGDADLYCNCTVATFPSACRWSAVATVAVEHLVIPAGRLQAGTLQCVVHGYLDSSYTLSVSLGSGTVLSAGWPVVAQSAAGSSQLYSLVFPAGDAIITVSVVADAGATVLYIGGYGLPPNSANFKVEADAATEQLQQLYSSQLCGANKEGVIPGSDPPLCQLQVLVLTPGPSTYRFLATADPKQLTALTAGLLVEGAASSNQSAYFSFSIPPDQSNATLIVTVSDGASGVTLLVGTQSSTGIRTLWTVTQQPGSSDLVFQLGWSDPLLPTKGQLEGEYAAVLRSTLEPATFSVVYTAFNIDSGITELLDGVPQPSIPSPSRTAFYYFTPPVQGWPYAVTVYVEWTRGRGSLAVTTTNGPQVVALNDAAWTEAGGMEILVSPKQAGVCNPTVNSTCGYSIGVYTQNAVDEYSITATSAYWVRELDPGSGMAAPGGVLAVDDSDYWTTAAGAHSWQNNPQLLIALTMLSGSATLFASNATRQPNASTAQQTSADVVTAAVLAFRLQLSTLNRLYFTVTCTSNDSTPCEYTLHAQQYQDYSISNVNNGRDASLFSPSTVLLPAGGMYWLWYTLRMYTTVAYLLMDASAIVGTASLYASCSSASRFKYLPVLPDETNHTWQAVTAPVAIELLNFNVTAAGCSGGSSLVLGVRAGSEQAALVDASVAVAGVQQDISYSWMAESLSTPAYPVSYFVYTLRDNWPSLLLAFTITTISGGCSLSQLQLVMSDTVPYPNPADPSTYNYSRTAVPLPNGAVDFTMAISSFSKPAGMVHAGDYYMAVTSTTNVNCQYKLSGRSYRQIPIPLGRLMQQTVASAARDPSYFTFAPVPYNTSTSLAIRLYSNAGDVMLYVGVNSTPSPADPSTYVLATRLSLNSTRSFPGSTYYVTPIYLPASACSSTSQLDQQCTVMVLSISTQKLSYDSKVFVDMLQMSSAGAIWLQERVTLVDTTSPSTTFQFSLPASPLSVALSVTRSSPVAIFCSYQYVTPDWQHYDWQSSSSTLPVAAPSNSTVLSFTWGLPQMQTNPGTPLAAIAIACYCTVEGSDPALYSVAYATAPLNAPPAPSSSSSSTSSPSSSASISAFTFTSSLSASSSTPSTTLSSTSSSASVSSSTFPSSTSSSPASSSSAWLPVRSSSGPDSASSSTAAASDSSLSSSHSGLGSGALAAAVVVPVVTVLVLVAVLLLVAWRRSAACCAGVRHDKSSHEHGSSLDDAAVSKVSMTGLSGGSLSGPRDDGLLQQKWSSDSA